MTAIAPSPLPRHRKPKGQGASRRGEILAAAIRIFRKEGVGHATMRRIAAAVGVSPTALYVYFPDKDAILQAIAESTFADLLAALEASQHSFEPGTHADPETAVAQLRHALRAYIDFGLSQPDAYRVTFLAEPGRDPADTEPDPCRTVVSADHSFEMLLRKVQQLMAMGLFRPGSAQAVAEAIWACMHGITILLLDQAGHLETPRETLIEQMIEIVITGCR